MTGEPLNYDQRGAAPGPFAAIGRAVVRWRWRWLVVVAWVLAAAVVPKLLAGSPRSQAP